MTIGVYVLVKFRAFGFTFGRLEHSFSVGYDLVTKALSVLDVPMPSPAALTVVNQRGVLVQVWV